MFTIKQIPRILSSLITDLALTMPVAYISNIHFYRNGQIVGNCNWDSASGPAAKIFDKIQPAYITFNQNFDNFTDIEVSAIDSEGRELKIRPALAHYHRNH